LDYAKISKEVIIIGALNRIELWAPELLNQHEVSQYSPSDSYFEDLGNIL
jgi:DNA-binding transcriptional regulator/RsmH inhibitor MraZ